MLHDKEEYKQKYRRAARGKKNSSWTHVQQPWKLQYRVVPEDKIIRIRQGIQLQARKIMLHKKQQPYLQPPPQKDYFPVSNIIFSKIIPTYDWYTK